MFPHRPLAVVRPRTATRTLAVAVSAIVAATVITGPSTAAEPRPTASRGGFDNPYAEPLDALGGETLAQFLVRHHEARLALR